MPAQTANSQRCRPDTSSLKSFNVVLRTGKASGMSDTFQLVFRGKLLGGQSAEQVQATLAKLFKTDSARIAACMAQPKWVVRTGMAKEHAQRMQEALRQAGLMTALIADDASAAAVPAQATPAATAAPQSAVNAVVPAAASAPALAGSVSSPQVNASNATDAEDSKGIVTLRNTTQVFSTPPGGLSADTPSGPLDARAKASAPTLDLSAYSLAAEGAILDEKRTATGPAIDTSALSLAAEGTPIPSPEKPKARSIDTSALSLDSTPIPEKTPAPLWSELE
jgi:hypothetical protein